MKADILNLLTAWEEQAPALTLVNPHLALLSDTVNVAPQGVPSLHCPIADARYLSDWGREMMDQRQTNIESILTTLWDGYGLMIDRKEGGAVSSIRFRGESISELLATRYILQIFELSDMVRRA